MPEQGNYYPKPPSILSPSCLKRYSYHSLHSFTLPFTLFSYTLPFPTLTLITNWTLVYHTLFKKTGSHYYIQTTLHTSTNTESVSYHRHCTSGQNLDETVQLQFVDTTSQLLPSFLSAFPPSFSHRFSEAPYPFHWWPKVVSICSFFLFISYHCNPHTRKIIWWPPHI